MIISAGEVKQIYVTLDPELEDNGFRWASPGEKLGGESYTYYLPFANTFGQPIKITHGAWWDTWWSEGGWNSCEITGQSKVCTGQSRIPAEPTSYNARLTYFVHDMSGHELYRPGAYGWSNQFISCQIYQNPDTLSPSGRPKLHLPWSGLKDFPVPITPYSGIYFERISLPAPGAGGTGEIVVRLIAPNYCEEFGYGDIGVESATERRYGRASITNIPPGYFTSFTYEVRVVTYSNLNSRTAQESGTISLINDDESAVFSIPITMSHSLDSGDYYIALNMRFRAQLSDGKYENYVLFMSPKESRYCLYPAIGIIRE